MKCPNCDADDLTEWSKFCRNCGKSVPPRCVVCGSFNSQQVAFCVECGGRLTKTFVENTHSNQEGHSNRPYVVWEGWPFAWLERRSQTKRQYIFTLLITVVLLAFIISGLLVTGPGDGFCMLIIFAVIVPFLILLHWKAGREGAYEEEKRSRDD